MATRFIDKVSATSDLRDLPDAAGIAVLDNKLVFHNGTSVVGVGTSAEVLSEASTLTAADSGKTYFLNSATEFAVTLPSPALGLNFLFIVAAAPSSASYTVVTPASAQIIVGHVLVSDGTDSAGDIEATAGATTITFVDGAAVLGDRCHVISDGTNWYASAQATTNAAITFTG